VDVRLREAAPSELPVLANLVSLYRHDFSELFGDTPDDDGTFGYPGLQLFFADAHRFPFFIRAEGSLAGFVLVSKGSVVDASPEVWDVSEFFVVRGLRRRGVGQAAASAVFRQLGGAWEARVLNRNPGALKFWPSVISDYTRGQFEAAPWQNEEGAWTVFRFSHDKLSAA
jgi:predicted acetyltransferase